MSNFKSGFNSFVQKSRDAINNVGNKDEKSGNPPPKHVVTYNNTPTHGHPPANNQNSTHNNVYPASRPPVQQTPPPPPTHQQQPTYLNKQPSGNNLHQYPNPNPNPNQTPNPNPNQGVKPKIPLSKPPPALANHNPQQSQSQSQFSHPAATVSGQPFPPRPPKPQSSNPAVQPQHVPSDPVVSLEKQPQQHQQIQKQNSFVSLEKQYQPHQQPQYQPQPQHQHQQDGASDYYLQHQKAVNGHMNQNNGAPKEKSLSASLSSTKNAIDTHSRIALTTIGAGDAVVVANYPELLLNNQMYISTLQYTEIILEIDDIKLKPCLVGQKDHPVVKNTKMIIYKTVIDDTIILQFGHIYIYTNYKEKCASRIYPYHYLISDNFNNYFILKIPKDTPQESMDKLEVLFTFYSSYYRTPVKKEGYTDETAQKMDKATTKLEKGSLVVSKGLVTGGTYFAKGAAKVGELYKNNTKKYDGPEMTEEQRRELEDPNSEANKSKQSAEKMAQGSSSIKKGIVSAFGVVGSKAAEGVRKTDWYKEREEKKKKEEELNGKNEKKAAGASMGSAGVSAFTNVWGGLEEGVLISARGVRDASVDATRHKEGDYEAEVSRKKWDSAGSCTISVINIMSIVSTTWIKGALYAASGAIKYDPDKAQNLTGSYWKAGWVVQKSDLLSGSGWSPRWMVLRNPTIAVYSSPLDPSDKPIASHYVSKVKGVRKLTEDRVNRSCGFEVVTVGHSLYFSTYTPEVDWSNELIQPPHPETELAQWVDGIINVSTFIGENM